MKKLNKKGFTLIELLAVIVVLAIIMVIAGSRILRTISKSRMDSFDRSMDMVVNNAKMILAQDGSLGNGDTLRETTDYNTSEFTISYEGNVLTITAGENGQFKNVTTVGNGFEKNDKYCYKTSSDSKEISTTLDDNGNPSIGDLSGCDGGEEPEEG